MPKTTYKRGKISWLDLQAATAADFDDVRKVIPSLEDADIDAALKVGQRPHIEERKGYHFLALFFPVYNRATREIEPAEIDFLIAPAALVTVHDGRLSPLLELLSDAEGGDPAVVALMERGSCFVVIGILERLLRYCNPMLDHISADLHTIDQQIFHGRERATVREILIARRNITDFRKIMQAHKNTLKKLLEVIAREPGSDTTALRVGIEALITRTKDIWDHLESFKESIVDLHDTNESLISYNLNEIMKNYTTISVVIFSMTLVATTFGVGARSTPLIERPGAFWILSVFLVLIALGMLEYFRKRKWL